MAATAAATALAIRAWAPIRLRERGISVIGAIVVLVRVVEQQLAGEAATRVAESIGSMTGVGRGPWALLSTGPLGATTDALAAAAGTVDGWTFGAAEVLLLLLVPVGGPLWAGVVPVGTTVRAARSCTGRAWAGIRVIRNVSQRPAAHDGRVRTPLVIVDDNAGFLDQARQLLARQGFDVVGTAHSIAEALATVATCRPEVALVDVNLGPESGFDLARQLAQADQGPPVTTVMMSTHAEEDLADLVAASPAAGFVAKERLSGAAVRAFLPGSA